MALIDGDYSEVLETTCDTSIVAVGSTLYEISGLGDLSKREMEVVDMASHDCITEDTPSSAKCYR